MSINNFPDASSIETRRKQILSLNIINASRQSNLRNKRDTGLKDYLDSRDTIREVHSMGSNKRTPSPASEFSDRKTQTWIHV